MDNVSAFTNCTASAHWSLRQPAHRAQPWPQRRSCCSMLLPHSGKSVLVLRTAIKLQVGKSCSTRPAKFQAVVAQAAKTDELPPPKAVTRLRVERQTFLPASRDESWKGFVQLYEDGDWDDAKQVIAALESIYRAEFQRVGDEVCQAFREANKALQAVPPVDVRPAWFTTALARLGRPDARQPAPPQPPPPDDDPGMGGSSATAAAAAEEANLRSASHASTSNGSGEYHDGGQAQHSRMHPAATAPVGSVDDGGMAPLGEGLAWHRPGDVEGPSTSGHENGYRSSGNGSGSGGPGHAAASGPHSRLTDTPVEAVARKFRSTSGAADTIDTDETTAVAQAARSSANGQPIAEKKKASEKKTSAYEGPTDEDPAVEPVILDRAAATEYSVVSRQSLDERLAQSIDGRLEPEVSDEHFLQLLMGVLQAAHFLPLTGRDVAMSSSLNSDYLARLFIKVRTSKMDRDLVARRVKGKGLPPDEQTLLVFKRGYGQARQQGKLLSKKLDLLQLMLVGGAFQAAASWLRTGYAAATKRYAAVRVKYVQLRQEAQPAGTRDDAPESEIEDELQAVEEVLDRGVWSRLKRAGRAVWGTLSDWGLAPRLDVIPPKEFDGAYPLDEPPRLEPVFIERVAIRDAVGGGMGVVRGGVKGLLQKVELLEPTFQELLVLYRQAPEKKLPATWKQMLFGREEEDKKLQYQMRNPIMLRIYKDIPVPTWKVVFPEKLLQFRPVDGLRADLISLAGLAGVLFQGRYDNLLVEIATIASLLVFLGRGFLSYRRMLQRFESTVNDMLRDQTIASQEGGIEYLASSAALQQFNQAGLAYTVLHQAEFPMTAETMCATTESLLEYRFGVRVRFNAEEALSELDRLGLLEKSQEEDSVAYRAVEPDRALENLKAHWDRLLMRRMDKILEDVANF